MPHHFADFIQPQIVLTISRGVDDSLKLGYRWPWMEERKNIDLPEATVTLDRVTTLMTTLRPELTDESRRYEEFLVPGNPDKVSCDPNSVRDLWLRLAKWGRSTYIWLFDLDARSDENLIKLSESIRELAEGSRISIDALRVPLPWGLFYDGELPARDDPKFFAILFSHFWGIKYRLEVRAPYGANNYINQPPVLGNTQQTRMMFAINQQSDQDYHTSQIQFFNDLESQLKPLSDQGKITLMLNTSKEKVIESLATRTEPQHLYYFFCHHQKGEGQPSVMGFRDYLQPTEIILQGIRDGVITLRELSETGIKPFRFPPVVFLNACQSGQHETGDPTSFMTFFIHNLHSWNYIGTAADVPAAFADKYGQQFVDKFLEAVEVGEITYQLNRQFALNHLNPFALYYTLFGLGQIRLERKIKNTES